MKKGSGSEKAITAAEERMAQAAAAARNKGPKDIEPQWVSDNQVRAAHTVLHQVKESLAATKQGRPLEHVELAIKEINISLKVK